jgi:hypothetical protein
LNRERSHYSGYESFDAARRLARAPHVGECALRERRREAPQPHHSRGGGEDNYSVLDFDPINMDGGGQVTL